MLIVVVKHLRASRIERIRGFIKDLKDDYSGDHIDKLKRYREPASCQIFGSGKYDLLPPAPPKNIIHHKPPKIVKVRIPKMPKVSDFSGQGHGQHGLH